MIPKETTRERFDRQVRELGGKPAYEVWLGVMKPHKVICKEGHECSPRPNDVQNGRGICRACAGNDPVTAEREFKERITALGGIVVYDKWLGNHKPHKVICKDGHECSPRPNSVQQGQGICKICGNKQIGREAALNAEKNFRASVEALGGKPAYDKWRGNGKPHKVICKDGHECNPRPNDVQKGQGICRVCAGRDSVTAEREFRERVITLGGIAAYAKWQGTRKPHRVICKDGHECNPRPSDVQRGHGICRKCAGHDYDAFYIVRNPLTYIVKFGVTSGDTRARLSDHRGNGYTEQLYLKTEFPEAYALECAVKIGLFDSGFEPVQGREYFRDDCLPFLMSMLPDLSHDAVY